MLGSRTDMRAWTLELVCPCCEIALAVSKITTVHDESNVFSHPLSLADAPNKVDWTSSLPSLLAPVMMPRRSRKKAPTKRLPTVSLKSVVLPWPSYTYSSALPDVSYSPFLPVLLSSPLRGLEPSHELGRSQPSDEGLQSRPHDPKNQKPWTLNPVPAH